MGADTEPDLAYEEIGTSGRPGEEERKRSGDVRWSGLVEDWGGPWDGGVEIGFSIAVRHFL